MLFQLIHKYTNAHALKTHRLANTTNTWTNKPEAKLTNIVMASAVLSLFNSSSIELSDEKESVKFLDCTISINSSYSRQENKGMRLRASLSKDIKQWQKISRGACNFM